MFVYVRAMDRETRRGRGPPWYNTGTVSSYCRRSDPSSREQYVSSRSKQVLSFIYGPCPMVLPFTFKGEKDSHAHTHPHHTHTHTRACTHTHIHGCDIATNDLAMQNYSGGDSVALGAGPFSPFPRGISVFTSSSAGLLGL